MAPNQTARRARAAFICALISFAVVVASAVPAGAHAIVEKTEPGIDQVVEDSPERVLMKFSEPVEIAFGAVRVFDTNGERVDRGTADHTAGNPDEIAVGLESDLPDGTYTVTWRVVSADSHPISEAFVFHVGAPGSRPEGIASEVLGGESGSAGVAAALFGVTRWTIFGALITLVGALSFAAFVWFGVKGTARPTETERVFGERWRAVVTWSWAPLVVSTLASIVLQGVVAGGLPWSRAFLPSTIGEVVDTRYGLVAVLRLGLLVAGAALFVVAARRSSVPVLGGRQMAGSVGAAARPERVPVWTALAATPIVAGLLLTPGLQGHAGTTSPVAVNLTADALHLFAAAAWIGGLVVLAFAVWPAGRAGDGSPSTWMAPVVARFSDLAVFAVGIVVVTGAYRSFVEVGAWRALTGTAYGLTLLAKLAVFVPLVALGAVNNRWLKPKLGEAERDGPGALTTLRRVVGVEVALGAVVIVATALLVNLAPARVEAGVDGPFLTEVRLGDANLEVLVDPNEVGENEVHLTATEASGAPFRMKQLAVLFRMAEQDIGPLRGEGRKLAPGHYVVQGSQLSVPGEWQLEIVARVDRFSEERATIRVEVNN